jgi:hypothetical protein
LRHRAPRIERELGVAGATVIELLEPLFSRPATFAD